MTTSLAEARTAAVQRAEKEIDRLAAAHAQLEKAHQAVMELTLDNFGDDRIQWARARAIAYRERAEAWDELAEAAPFELHRHYFRAALLASVHDRDTSELYWRIYDGRDK